MQREIRIAAGRPDPATKQHFDGGARVVEVACDRCGAKYLDYIKRVSRAKRHYCSRACQMLARTGDRNPHWRGGKIECVCRNCAKKFFVIPAEIKNGRGRHCSRACKVQAARVYPDKATMRREARRRREAWERAGTRLESHSYAEWQELVRRAKGRCAKCKRKRALTRDHIIPLSKGGHDGITNVQPLCRPCNTSKHNRVETLL